MNDPKKNSKVRQKLTAAIALLNDESPGQPICVSALCKMAGVNRSNIYASHSDILADLRSRMPDTRSTVPEWQAGVREPGMDVTRLRLQNKALLYLCVELQSSISDLEKRVPRKQERKFTQKKSAVVKVRSDGNS